MHISYHRVRIWHRFEGKHKFRMFNFAIRETSQIFVESSKVKASKVFRKYHVIPITILSLITRLGSLQWLCVPESISWILHMWGKRSRSSTNPRALSRGQFSGTEVNFQVQRSTFRYRGQLSGLEVNFQVQMSTFRYRGQQSEIEFNFQVHRSTF